MKLRRREKAQAIVLGAVLMFGMAVTAMSVYQAQFVPADNKKTEFQAFQETRNDLENLRGTILRTASTSNTESLSVKTGAQYSPRTLFINPPWPNGNIRTTNSGKISLENFTSTDSNLPGADVTPSVKEYWNGSTRSFTSKELLFNPNYNEFQAPEMGITTGALLYINVSGNRTVRETGTNLVDGDRISVISLVGNVSTGGQEAALEMKATSPFQNTISVTNTSGKTPTIVIPSRVSNDSWSQLLANEEKVTKVTDRPGGRVAIQLKKGWNYRLRMAQVEIRSRDSSYSVSSPGPKYLVKDPSSDSLVANATEGGFVSQVRDKFNNPLSNVDVDFDILGYGSFTGAGQAYAQTSDQDGRSTAPYAPNHPGNHYLHASFNKSTAPMNETFIRVRSGSDQPPEANTSGTNPTITEGLSMNLIGANSTSPAGRTLAHYNWLPVGQTYGYSIADTDGKTLPNATFNAPNNVDSNRSVHVALVVNDSTGVIDTALHEIKIINQPPAGNSLPTADASGPYIALERRPIKLDGTGSSDPDGSIVTYSWSITTAQATLNNNFSTLPTLTNNQTSTPTFNPGTLTAATKNSTVDLKLTVTDNAGATHTAYTNVTVEERGLLWLSAQDWNNASASNETGVVHENFGDHANDTVRLGYPSTNRWDSAPIAYWPLDEDSGTVANDVSGNNRDIGNELGVSPSKGVAGLLQTSSYDFAGAGPIEDPNGNTYIEGLNQVTVSMWIKPSQADVGSNNGFINGQSASDQNDNGFGIRYDSGGASGGGTNVIKAVIDLNGAGQNGEFQIESSSNVHTTNWQHIALVWSDGNPLTLYINGTKDTPTFTSGNGNGPIGDPDFDTLKLGEGPKNNNNWGGKIDEVRIYNQALTAQEVGALYNTSIRGNHSTSWQTSSFANNINIKNTDLELNPVNTSLNGGNITAYVEVDDDNDQDGLSGDIDANTSAITIDGSGSYTITGGTDWATNNLQGNKIETTDRVRLRVEMDTPDVTKSPKVDYFNLRPK